MTKVRVGIIGTGGIAGVHVEGIKYAKDKVECVALCDVSEDNLKRRREQLGGDPALFRDWKDMLAKAGDTLDAVVICLPHHLHSAAILDAANAGKHILCEKPMCIRLDEAEEIIKTVARTGVTYMSAHNQLFMPAVREARRMVDAGMIGKLRWVRSQDCFVAGFKKDANNWRADLKTQGGGELIDTGYHPTYRMLYLAGGKIEAVRGTFARFQQPIQGEDTASVQVRFDNGVIGEVFTSWAVPLPHGTHQIHLLGDKGQIYGSGGTLHYLPSGFREPATWQAPTTVESFSLQMEHFADCLLNKTRPIHGPEEGRDVLQVILQAAESAAGWEKTAQA